MHLRPERVFSLAKYDFKYINRIFMLLRSKVCGLSQQIASTVRVVKQTDLWYCSVTC